MAERKGIRINALAKELGVASSAIIQKLKEEGLPAPANHQSTISLGLAESVREWFTAVDGGGTAVEVAPPVEAKPKLARPKKKVEKSIDSTGDDDSASGEDTAAQADHSSESILQPTAPAAPVVEAPAPVAQPAPVTHGPAATPVVDPVVAEPTAPALAPVAPPVVDTPLRPAAVAPVAPSTATPSAPTAAPTIKPGMPPARPAVGGSAPTAAATSPSPAVAPAAATAAPSAPSHPRGPGGDIRPPVSRPTVTLDSIRAQQAPPPIRKPVTPAPKLTALAPAQIQGPRVIREEKPENLPAPRPRMRPGDGPQSSPATGYSTARPTTGRGVKVAEEDTEGGDKKGTGNKKGAASLSSRRRGVDGRRGEAMEKLKEFTEADLIARRDALLNAAGSRAEFEGRLKKTQTRGMHHHQTVIQRGDTVEIEEPITVKSLSAAIGVKSNDIIKLLMKQGVFATVNQGLDRDTAEAVALNFGLTLEIAQQQTLEQELLAEIEDRPLDESKFVRRPTVVTILGHVDHGKTSLLDKIRNANVAAGEAGGITQHTAAWQVTLKKGDDTKQVTFIDTPGHQAFTAMRARGANMTDVVVLVVAAVEGVMPQTIESIAHARAAEVPIVVALNKIDRPDANPDMVLGQLAAQGLNPSEWGGDTEVVRTSAITGQGIEELIEVLDYQSELLDLKADPSEPARGSVIESRVDPGLGPVATVLVQEGTLKVGDAMLSGPGYGRIRALRNDRGEMIREAGPGTPCIVSGLADLPSAGDKFYVLDDVDRARSIAEERSVLARQDQLALANKVSLENLFDQMKAGDVKTINLIIKGDVQGSVETLAKTVLDQNTEEVKVKVIHSAVGPISESDVELADASNAVIIGFHVVPDESARVMAEQRRIEIRTYRVIYEIFYDLKKALSGLLEPEVREKLHGHLDIRQVFKFSKVGSIAGCFVTDGHVQRGSRIRLIRDGKIITEDLAIETLRRVKEDVREAKAGFECGVKLAGYDDIKVGDRLEAYVRETIQRTL